MGEAASQGSAGADGPVPAAGPSAPSADSLRRSYRAEMERLSDRWADLGRLKVLGLVAPMLFLIVIEGLRWTLVEKDTGELGGHMLLAIIEALGVIVFSLFIFLLIDRAQRRVLRQNRDLAAANAVSVAVRSARSVDETVDAAIEALLAASGADTVTVTRFVKDAEPPGAAIVREGNRDGRLGPAAAVPLFDPGALSVPLTIGDATLGSLRISGVTGRDLVSFETVQTVAQQLASSLQTAQLIAGLERGKAEGFAFFDVLLQLSSQRSLPDTLASVVHHLREHLAADEVVISVNAQTAKTLSVASELTPLGDGSVCMSSDDHHARYAHAGAPLCPVRSSPDIRTSMVMTVRGTAGVLGDVWVGRRAPAAFTPDDRRFLESMAELVSVAITGDRMRTTEELTTILAERERIAREMHDGMAQMLGVTHLRLRALEASPELADSRIGAEITELADLCQDAYQDVREHIMGLRESPRGDRGLIPTLRTFVERYQRQSGITTVIECAAGDDLVLTPRAELELVRVIQEALTNVRKHAGARSVVVRIDQDGTGTTLVVEDDGAGFDSSVPTSETETGGYGLHSMRERMELLGGSLVVQSSPGRGTRVVASLPAPTGGRLDRGRHADA